MPQYAHMPSLHCDLNWFPVGVWIWFTYKTIYCNTKALSNNYSYEWNRKSFRKSRKKSLNMGYIGTKDFGKSSWVVLSEDIGIPWSKISRDRILSFPLWRMRKLETRRELWWSGNCWESCGSEGRFFIMPLDLELMWIYFIQQFVIETACKNLVPLYLCFIPKLLLSWAMKDFQSNRKLGLYSRTN